MYAVVGCDECAALWIVEGDPETSQCPRCGRTRGHEKRREFVTTENEGHAREVRSSMLAARQGEAEAFAELDSFAELEGRVEEAGIDDETYLEGSGLDPEQIAEAAEEEATSKSREEIVREAVRALDTPTEADILEYTTRRDVPADYTERALAKLVRAGEATESGGTYRLL